ncbi:MAG: maltodextrose utilization protein MalA [Sporolactobacillus sp.]|nr:maltodextrose utilization protein MalA [Sporolactobacillus sp.]
MKSRTDLFPLNYFIDLCSPAKIFQERQAFKWRQLLFLFVFVSGCLMLPVSFQLTQVRTVPMSILAPHVNQQIDHDFLTRFAGSSIANRTLRARAYERIEGKDIVAVDLTGKWQAEGQRYHKKIRGFSNALIFQSDRLILCDQNGFGFQLLYPGGETLTFNGARQDLYNHISRLWLRHYQTNFVGVVSFLGFMIVLVGNFLVWSAAALMLWLTKRTGLTAIHSLQEAVAIVLMSAGIPTVGSVIAAFIQFNIGILTLIQSGGLVVMIALVFGKTHFQDSQNVVGKSIDSRGQWG